LQRLIALLSQRRQMYIEVGNLTIKSKKVTLTLILLTWRIWWAPNNASRWQMGFNSASEWLSRLLNNYSSKFIGVSSALCRYSVITFLTVYLLYPVILKHCGCTNYRWQVTKATTFCTVVPNINESSLRNSFHVTILAPRILGWLWGETSPLCVTNIIKMKRNRNLNTTNGLLAEMESSYVTCFGLLLWPSSGYNLVVLRVYTICLSILYKLYLGWILDFWNICATMLTLYRNVNILHRHSLT